MSSYVRFVTLELCVFTETSNNMRRLFAAMWPHPQIYFSEQVSYLSKLLAK